MSLEEKTLEKLQEHCEECGTRLTETEISAAIDGSEPFLCSRCASEQVEVDEEHEGNG